MSVAKLMILARLLEIGVPLGFAAFIFYSLYALTVAVDLTETILR